MSERRAQSVEEPAGRRAVVWFSVLIFTCLASGWAVVRLPSALKEWGWEKPKGLELSFALVLSAGPLFVALGLIYLLWRRLGTPFSRSPAREPRSKAPRPRREWPVDPSSAFRRRFLWSLALLFLCYAVHRARDWFPSVWYELNRPAQSLAEFARSAGWEGGLVLLAIGLMPVLWRVVGPPLVFQRGRSPEAAEPGLQWKSFESSGESERRSQDESAAAASWRASVWSIMFALLLGSSGWALLCVACAAQPSGWPMTEADDAMILTVGLAPIAVLLLVSPLLWALVGPPFPRRSR